MSLTFDEAAHQYAWDGKPVVNVTRVLDHFCNTYAHVPKDVLERARQQGTAIHRAVELHLAGNVGHMPAWLEPYLAAWERFVFDTGFVLEASERRLFHSHFQFAGTADLFGWIDMRRVGVQHACIDLKRSFMAGPAIGLQTAAYSGSYNQNAEVQNRIQARFALRFKPGASPPYELKQYSDREDFAIFTSMLQTYRWLDANGKIEHGHLNDRKT